ncbi:hypothetical protein C0J52_22799 [Blattella germanica]|nr:hypothetical protein C0J52_22799 [Blattella germanica]PSN36222.1 hypothetical protein C0J52_22799 [Blattella germanica]
MDIQNTSSETLKVSSKDDSIEMTTTSKTGTKPLDTGINVDFAQPCTSRGNDQIPSDNPPSSEHEKLLPVDSSETTSETSERNKTAWSKANNEINDLYQLIKSDVSKLIRDYFNRLGVSMTPFKFYELQADTGILLGYASQLNYRFALLFRAAERVPFSKIRFNFHKMEMLEHCTIIEEHLMVIENKIKHVYKMYYELNNLEPSDDEEVLKAALGYLVCVNNKINAVVSCLETLDQPDCLSPDQLNLDLEGISEDRTEVYDPEPYNQEDFCAIDWKFVFIGFHVVVLCILLAAIYEATSKW